MSPTISRILSYLLALAVVLPVVLLGVSHSEAATLRMARVGADNADGKRTFSDYVKGEFEKKTGHKIEFVSLPFASDEKLGILQQTFSVKAGDTIDVFQIDTVWPGLLDPHLLDLTDHVQDLRPAFFQHAWDNSTVKGRQKAVPAFLDVGGLYYRADLLEKYGQPLPQTWDELARIAAHIQEGERREKPRFWGYVFQGKSYEGLTCNALEWISSSGGGVIVDPDGTVTVDNPQAARALDVAAGWVGTIAPKGVLGYMEEEARALFQNGDAAFLRNWSYVYGLAQAPDSPVRGKIGVAPLPRGDNGQSTSALGGWHWAVNAYTRHPEAAIELIRFLSSAEMQKQQFLRDGNVPGRLDVYDDPAVRERAPWLGSFRPIFLSAVARPSSAVGAAYPRVSKAVFNGVYQVLSGQSDGTKAVADLKTRLERIKGKGWYR